MPIEGISATEDIFVHVDEEGVAQIFETPGGRGSPAQVDVTYRCAWKDRYAVIRNLAGGFSQLNGLGVPTPGHAYPPSPNLYCDSIGRIDPLGVDKTLLKLYHDDPDARRWSWPKWCLIPATYRPIEYAYSVEQSYSPSQEVVQIDPVEPILGCRQAVDINNSFIVLDKAKLEILRLVDGSPARQDPRKIVEAPDGIPANTVNFTLEFPRVPRNPWRFLAPYVGKLNAFRMWHLDPGHILFSAVQVQTTWTNFGPEISATLTYTGNLDVGWNEILDDDGLVKPKVFVINNGSSFRYPFKTADLMAALR